LWYSCVLLYNTFIMAMRKTSHVPYLKAGKIKT
jgi:hypothetical protein